MQCYAAKDVERGKEFCSANFDPEEELENFLLCYESIPVFTMQYCQLKYKTDSESKIDCFRNKARLTLDQNYCDTLYPILEGSNGA